MEDKKKPTTPTGVVLQNELGNMSQMLDFSNRLTDFITEKKLFNNISGKKYISVEAWTFAGMSMGLMPIPVAIEDLSKEGEIKYKATVEIQNINTGQIMGRGFAICSNKEQKKKYFDEYAIASMAITRATGKAFRIPLGWLIVAAGYEPTPAEEMDEMAAKKPFNETMPEAATQADTKLLATPSQRAELEKLIQFEGFEEAHRVKVLANSKNYTMEQADNMIIRLKTFIQENQ